MKKLHAGAFFVAGTLAMFLLYRYEMLLFVLMLAASLMVLKMDGWKHTKAFAAAMVVGGICENLAVMIGAWSYSNASVIFTPLWLPVGWGMSVVLLENMIHERTHKPGFSAFAVALAFFGSAITASLYPAELLVLVCFAIVTPAFFYFGIFHKSEIPAGIVAALLGTAMESACIASGNWQYSAAFFGTPLWLPLCWFNAFLIMRRVIRV